MREFEVGSSLPRYEDLRLTRGRGRYTDDFSFTGQTHLYLLRSPHAAATIKSIDTSAARQAPGVVAVYTGADLETDGIGGIRCRMRRKHPNGEPSFETPYPALAVNAVHYVGDAVVAVIAETMAEAKSAAELVEIDYENLPAAATLEEATAAGAPAVWQEAPDNICFLQELGNKAAVDQAFAKAKHVVKERFRISRVATNSMEPRDAIGLYSESDNRFTLYAGLQSPHALRAELAQTIFKVPLNQMHVISPDTGGAFGMKGGMYPELILVLWAARKLGRPVKWISDRSESFLCDHQARDNISDVSLALDEDGKFLALRVETLASLGAYLSSNGTLVPVNNVGGLAGTYTTPHIHVAVTGVFCNSNPTCPYRGAGRPEASYCIERIIDIAARDTGIDRIELRRRNMIPASAMPFKTGLVYTYDSGDFEACMKSAMEIGDWKGAKGRAEKARRAGKLYGLGAVSVIEIAGGPADRPQEEAAEIRFEPTGEASVMIGSHNHGQGHETVFRQILHTTLGLSPDKVRIVYGDTDQVFHGRGTFGSRTMGAGGTAVVRASDKIIARGKEIAAHLLEAAQADIEFAEGKFTVAGTDRTIDIVDVAQAAFMPQKLPRDAEIGLNANVIVAPAGATFPNGFHICEVEIDPETGIPDILRYTVVDDVGRVVNPLLLKGQIHGGIAQGAGQALGEIILHDSDGQLLTGSFMDYYMPRADNLPYFTVQSHSVPTKQNALGVKGAGEAGTVGALPAIMNAINDALSPLGVRHFEMPATAERLWKVITEHRAG